MSAVACYLWLLVLAASLRRAVEGRLPVVCEDTAAAQRLFLPVYYKRNHDLVYDLDTVERTELIWQYNVYNSAAFLADKLGSNGWIIDVGCGNGRKAATLYQKGFNLYMLDWKDNLVAARANMEATDRYRQWVAGGRQGDSGVVLAAWDISGDLTPPEVPVGVVRGGVAVSSDVIEHLLDPVRLVRFLKGLVDQGARAVVVSTPDRELYFPGSETVPYKKDAQFWEAKELWALLACNGLPHVTVRHTAENFANRGATPKTILCVSSPDASLSVLPDTIPNWTAGDAVRSSVSSAGAIRCFKIARIIV